MTSEAYKTGKLLFAVLLAVAFAAPAQASDEVGLFIACFEVGNVGMPGAPVMRFQGAFNAPAKTVNGSANITQATNPPLDVHSNVHGNWYYMAVMGKKPDEQAVRIDFVGYPPFSWPSGAGIGPVIPPNVQGTIVLDNGWAAGTGTANYSYRASFAGPEINLLNQPVKKVACPTM